MLFINTISMERKLNKIRHEEKFFAEDGNDNLQIEHVKKENWLTIY